MYTLGKTNEIKNVYFEKILNEAKGTHRINNSLTNEDYWLDVFKSMGKTVSTEPLEYKGPSDINTTTLGTIMDDIKKESHLLYKWSIGEHDDTNPIALINGDAPIGKFQSIPDDDYYRIDGIILSNDYHNGDAKVYIFDENSGGLGVEDNEDEESEDFEDVEPGVDQNEIQDLNSDVAGDNTGQELNFDDIQLPESFEKDLEKYEKLFEDTHCPRSKLTNLIDGEYEMIKDYSLEDFKAYAKDAIENLTDEDIEDVYEAYLG